MRSTHLYLIIALLLLQGCASRPSNPHNLCEIFRENRGWYNDAKDAEDKWGAPLQIPMAFMYQESSFDGNAKPPMRWFLFIPIGRGSSAYGYAQAQTPAWKQYKKETGHWGADRDDFGDATNFIQWYMNKSRKVNGVSKWDPYRQYLNYHEGWTGYAQGSYKNKPWLVQVAKKVDKRAKDYGAQYRSCEKELDRNWLMRMLF